jgi:hypothetical protein
MSFEGDIAGSGAPPTPPIAIPPIESLNDFRKRVAAEFAPRRELILASWLTRKLPLRDYLLGSVLSSTSRWLIFGNTGVGKTLLAMSMAGAIASAGSFLGWEGKRRARVIYLDGEMPAETFKERMELVAAECGPTIALFGYNREDLESHGEIMPPLNTPEGQAWLWREIDAVNPDAIFFDSIMCLLGGPMTDEQGWEPIKLLMRKITARRIAQVWLHHTGHDANKQFGTKTREWELDTVVALKEEAKGVLLEFTKARLRTPKTAAAFKSRVIIRDENGWAVTGDAPPVKTANSSASGKLEIELLKREMLKAYDRLADDVEKSPGLDGAPVSKIAVEKLRDDLRSRGILAVDDAGKITATARSHSHRAKVDLITKQKTLIEADGMIWRR